MKPFGMTNGKFLYRVLLCGVLLAVQVFAQIPAPKASPLVQAIDLAEKQHHCEEALPLLKKLTLNVIDQQLRYRAQIATAHCAIKQKDGQATVTALLALKHEYPEDPEVLYLTTHVFLEIAVRASQELAATAPPSSYQIRELQAETLESQGKWEEAVAVYSKILEENPKLPNMHFRLGHAILSQPESPANTEEARKEFAQELAIDPTNASAEFWLGEIARLAGTWDEAIPHFASAARLDPNYPEAFLGWGMSSSAAGRYPEAIMPLERYTKLVPDDTAGHYQLAMAYSHADRKADAAREMTLMRQIAERKRATAQRSDVAD